MKVDRVQVNLHVRKGHTYINRYILLLKDLNAKFSWNQFVHLGFEARSCADWREESGCEL